jgi:hypothetical protein
MEPRDGGDHGEPSPPPVRVRALSSRTNRSTTRARSCSGMPGPSSLTMISPQPSAARVATVMVEPPYFSALSIRLASARDRNSRSAGTVTLRASAHSVTPDCSASGS